MKMSDYTLSMVNKVYSILIGLLSSVFYIRYLGLEYKGTYSYIGEVAGILTILLSLGLQHSYAYKYRRQGAAVRPFYARVFLCQFLCLCLICGALCFLGRREALFVMVACQLPVLTLRSEMESVMLVENIRAYLISDMVFKGVLCALYLVLWLFFPVNLYYLILPVLVLRFFECLYWVRAAGFTAGRADRAFGTEILRFGFLPMLSSLLITFNYTLDILFLKHMGTAAELSLYTLAALIINYVWTIPNAFKEVLTSRIARTDDEKAVRMCVKCSMLLTALVLLVYALAGQPLTEWVFGTEFAPSWNVTMILFIGAFPMILYKMMGVVFMTEGKRTLFFVPLLISACTNALANLWAIPRWGMYGAAWASVLSYSLCGCLFLGLYCRFRHTRAGEYLLISGTDLTSMRALLFGVQDKSGS